MRFVVAKPGTWTTKHTNQETKNAETRCRFGGSNNLGGSALFLLLLTVLGSAALLLVTVKYYWGERGTPPAKGEQRRVQKDIELRLRAKQIEHAAQNPVKPRRPGFFDNRKT